MPEGDTIHRTARTLERILGGQTVLAVDVGPQTPGQELAGRLVRQVEARGKNLLIHFDGDRVLYSHMRMSGSWHVYRAGERWHRPRRQLRIALHTDRMTATCFNAPVVELLTTFALRQHRFLSRLGPDLLARAPDLDDAVHRARTHDDATLGEAVMAQDVACGIGNVYKSESLFLLGESPFRLVRDRSDDELRSVFLKARELMQANLTGYPRITRGPERLHPGESSRYWVYGRGGEPCFRCGAPIQMRRQGDAGRSTYYCATCQPR